MTRTSARYLPAVALAAGLMTISGAQAQGVLPSGTMPPPPSASDPTPKSTTAKPRVPRTPRKPARSAESGSGELTASSDDVRGRGTRTRGATGSGYSEQIDTRPTQRSRDMQLEDDPRVRPTIENGRAGVGMRF